MASIPDEYRALATRGVWGMISTVDPDGVPNTTPVWIDFDDDRGHFLVNTVEGRLKERNLRRDPTTSLAFVHPEHPRRYLSVQGEAVAFTTEGAIEHFDDLARRLLGEEDFYEHRYEADVVRVIVRIAPDRVYSR